MRSTPKKLLRGSNKLVYKAAVSNDTAAFLFYSRPTGAVHAAAQNMLLSVLLHPPKRAKKHRFPCPKTGAGCPPQTIDISECTFFALLIYQFKDSHPGFLSCCSSTMYATFPRSETECLQNYCKIRRSSMMHPSFLCKIAKYTCCTVFRAKFIHFSEGVNSCAKTRAIFVRFLFRYLQFASFFLVVVLLS